jgi:hypothetical protein
VRKKPGSTTVARMPNGSTSKRSHSIQPSTPNLLAAGADELLVDESCRRRDRDDVIGPLLARRARPGRTRYVPVARAGKRDRRFPDWSARNSHDLCWAK